MASEREIDWLRHTVGVLALRDRAILSVSGDDALDWLQGQVTNQVEGIGQHGSAYGFVLTLKGRVLGDVWVLGHGDEIWLDVPAAQVQTLLERLDRYIIMEDVELAHHPELHVIAVQGPKAVDISSDGGWRSDRLGTGGRVWVVPAVELDAALDRWAARSETLGGGRISEQAWADAHVVFGRPRFGVDFGDWTYPQESGLSPVAVSFTKGCYIGQETVVMLESRGKAPKVLWRWTIEGSELPAAKTPIKKEGAVVGQITSAARFDDAVVALGFLKRGHQANPGGGFVVGDAAASALGPVEEGLGVGRATT